MSSSESQTGNSCIEQIFITVYHVSDSLLGTGDPDESETVPARRGFTVSPRRQTQT